MKNGESFVRQIWRWLALFGYRRWARGMPTPPVGTPFYRDPENRCDIYEPRPAQWNDWGTCQSDNHYLCEECCHLVEATDRMT